MRRLLAFRLPGWPYENAGAARGLGGQVGLDALENSGVSSACDMLAFNQGGSGSNNRAGQSWS